MKTKHKYIIISIVLALIGIGAGVYSVLNINTDFTTAAVTLFIAVLLLVLGMNILFKALTAKDAE